jgi:hypothetical protein
MSDAPIVLNTHHSTRVETRENPPERVYVGRPSKWGNPFTIGEHGTREVVIEKFRSYFYSSGTMMDHARELKGKDLVCFCAPLPCHADILLEFANKE